MRASIGAAIAGILFFVPANARAAPPLLPPAATAPPPPYGYAPPPYGYAPPPYGYAPPPKYPDYVYVRGAEESSAALSGPTVRVWYGWQTLLVLGGSATIGVISSVAGGVSGAGGVALVGGTLGGTGLLFGGPIVHWAHGNTGKGFVSLGINFGAPVVVGGISVAVICGAGGCTGGNGVFGILGGLTIGGSVGLLAAMIVDVSVLSYDNKAPDASSARHKAPGWIILPDLKISREKTTFGFAGVF